MSDIRSDTIKRSDAIKVVKDVAKRKFSVDIVETLTEIDFLIKCIPSADRPSAVYEYLKREIGDIVDSETEFDAWFKRMVWHVEECNRLTDRPHEVVANGNCAICGKPLSGDRVFICEECSKERGRR